MLALPAPKPLRMALGMFAVVTIWAVAGTAVALSNQPTIAVAAAIDFSLTAALALYLIAGRNGHLPRWMLGATIAIGAVFAKLVLGTADATRAVMALGLAFELGAIVWLAIRGRRALRGWSVARAADATIGDALTAALTAARFPARLASVLVTELTLLAMVIVGWRRPARSPSIFTVHRNSGWPIYAGVLIFLTLVETSVVHILLAGYVSTTAAWIATALSLYSALWFAGEVLALRHGGVIVGAHDLELRIGIRWRGRIAWSNVTSIERCEPRPAGVLDVSILGANVVLELREPSVLLGVLGRRREGTRIALSIDDVDAFVAAARTRLTS